jgi:hypothetical protein
MKNNTKNFSLPLDLFLNSDFRGSHISATDFVKLASEHEGPMLEKLMRSLSKKIQTLPVNKLGRAMVE